MNPPVDVFDIVKSYLTEHAGEYDGLVCNEVDVCGGGCIKEEMGECEFLNPCCKLGHKTRLDSEGFWILESGPKQKKEPSNG